jgi:hypothetical protein
LQQKEQALKSTHSALLTTQTQLEAESKQKTKIISEIELTWPA